MTVFTRNLLHPLLLASVTCLGFTGHANAQSAADQAARQAEEIQRRFSEQQRLFEAESLETQRRAPSGSPIGTPREAGPQPGGTCVNVKTITVTGGQLVPPGRIDAVTSKWQGRCLGLAELNGVLEDLTQLYLKRGYIASRAYLPEQDLSTGALRVEIVEGQLEDVVLKGEQIGTGRIVTAFPGMAGKPLNLRDVEQGLDQINRVNSSNATISLEPGGQLGDSVLAVAIERGQFWAVSYGADNLGSEATGIYQSRVDLGLDNVFGINDQWSFGYQRSMDRHPLFISPKRPDSNTLNGAVSVPYGYWTFGLNGSWSNYRSNIEGQFSQIETSGGSRMLSPYVSRVLHRDQTSKTWATSRLTWKETENFILGNRIDVSSRALAIGTIELGHSRQLLGGQANASVAYHRGLDVLGAERDKWAAPGTPRAQFNKFTASLGYFRAFPVGEANLLFNTSLNGQWSNDRLFGSEQISSGGFYTVRGVRDSVLYGDRGYTWRNEVSVLLPAFENAQLAKAFGRVEPYAALDFGRTLAAAKGNGVSGSMLGGAIGLRNRSGRVTFDISYSDLLIEPDLPAAQKPSSGLFLGRVAISF
jgi:hemolysin activation/secretion protein